MAEKINRTDRVKVGGSLRETLLKLLATEPNSTTLGLSLLSGRGTVEVGDALNSLREQGHVQKVGQVSFSLWRLGEPRHEQLVAFRSKPKELSPSWRRADEKTNGEHDVDASGA